MADEFDEADFFAAEAAAQRPAQSPRAATPNTSTATGGASKVVQPRPQALPQRQGPSAILVSTRQKGNPILKHVTSVPWEWAEIPCDYVLGATTCALFLSLKYHRLHPEYIYGRIRQLGKLYNLRIMLTMVDITNHEEALKELSKTSMINNLTLILCWSSQEAGRYLELYKSYEHASAASIRAHQAETYQESLTEFVTTPRNINKTDAASLISNFGSLRNAINAQPEELALVPGWGEKKIRAWVTTVREPFRVRRAAKSSAALLREESTLGGSDGGANTPAERSESGAHTPIPIGRVSTVSRQGSNVVVTSNDAEEAGPSQKRPRLEAVHVDAFQTTEEAALLALAEEETKMTDAEKPKAAQAVTRKEPELSEGVMAALAKLREQG